MKKSQIIFSQYSPLMAIDTELVGSDGKAITTPGSAPSADAENLK